LTCIKRSAFGALRLNLISVNLYGARCSYVERSSDFTRHFDDAGALLFSFLSCALSCATHESNLMEVFEKSVMIAGERDGDLIEVIEGIGHLVLNVFDKGLVRRVRISA